ncbi:FAD:protein FMN transferase [Ruegeria sp. 2012CJ41-6]|uniref:FAD:protein FMN transferase n=1 Tax=Ruegeria spongiae TaxID=2942209 RepID=A0ABT0Q570_9RHOB|nr:FAD:protein FMN transferase [Ruegeria spongiae]MCL6284960.1 FAD:protein FMN transferase [Ruegeria spongiae]
MLRWFPLLLPAALAGCLFDEDPEVLRLSGETMGTTYNITAVGTDLDGDAMAAAVTDSLASINAKMSNWDPNSEVSVFSASADTQAVAVSPELASVMAAANEVHTQSMGRFDVTLGPLIELWGFGPRKPEDPVPGDDAIAAALAHVGQDRLLALDEDAGTLSKSDAAVGINLGAIAKGYGVDAVAAALAGFGVENYMVEIGGDLVTRGENDKGETWRIGIERPDANVQTVELIVPVSDRGLATSGDYRNFFEQDGVRYSHIIDPTTGHPITHRTTSVTVVANDAMMADAWATALLVLGAEDGLKLADENNLAAFFISQAAQDGVEPYIVQQSSAFAAILAGQ